MKRSLAFMLVMVMLLCLLPSTAFAKTDTITSSIATVTLDWNGLGVGYDVDVEIYLDGVQKAKQHAQGKGPIVGIALNIDDGYNYVYDKCDANKLATVTINPIASDGLSNGSKQAKYSGNLTLVDTRKTTTVKLYLKSRGSEAKPNNYDNIITNYVKRDDVFNKNHGFTHKVFEWRDDINFTYYVERTPGVISNNFAAKLKFQKYDLQGKPVGSEDIAYAWNMHDLDGPTKLTLASDNYWFETHCVSGFENKAFYTVDNVAGGDNQICFGSSALKTVKLENLPGYVIRAFPLNIPLTSEELCTVKQVNKATDDDCCTFGHGKEMRHVEVYLNGVKKADANNTIDGTPNVVYFPNRGDNMKASDIVVTNTNLENQYYHEIVVKENDKTYEIHYYNYIYKLNLNANDGTGATEQRTSGEQAVPNRSYTFENLPSMEREGYTFLGWADSQADADNGKVSYNAGDSLTLNYTNGTDGQSGVTEKTIYAVWQATGDAKVPITLSYDGNGGTDTVTGVPTQQTSYVNAGESASFTIPTDKPSRAGYKFLGWATANDGTGTTNKPGDTFTTSQNATLYGIWEKLSISYGDLKGLIGDISVSCVSAGAHEPKTTQLINGSYSESQEGDTLTVTINAGEYVKFYNEQVTEKTHRVYGDTAKIVVLKYDHTKDAWEVESGKPVEFRVTCAEDIPQPPVDPDEDIWNWNEPVVKVNCETGGHDDKEYPLLKGHFDLSTKDPNGNDITSSNPWKGKDGKYYCYININNAAYCDTYSKETDIGAEHELCDPTAEGERYQLIYEERDVEGGGKGGKWKLVGKTTIPTINVKHATTNPGSVSAVTKTRLTDVANVPLPENVTINTDETVKFTDDNTSATLLYAFTVTGTPGAEVVIKDTGATFIKNTTPISTVPQQITVTLPAAVGDETETSTTVYGYRTFSVDDIENGKLVNNATANVTNGDPNNDKTGTEDVPALDNRTLYNTLTVKKLVSGNAANTTEKFPFKATFTFPVPVASPTQDGVTYGETVEINFELAHDQTRTFSYTSDAELKTKIDKWMEEYKAYGLYTGDNVFAMLRYKVEETDTKGYTLTTNGDAEGEAKGHNTVTFTNTKNKPNDDHGGHYHPTTTPVPVIVIPPKTGDMPFWYSIAQFLGLVK